MPLSPPFVLEGGSGTKFQLLPLFHIVGPFLGLTRNLGACQQKSHKQTQIHKTHHGLDLGETTTFFYIAFSMCGHRANTQMSFCLMIPNLGVPKFPKLELSRLWRPITSCANLQLR
jgi:hypothetical protein